MIVVTWNVQGLDDEYVSMRSEAAAHEMVLGCSLASIVAGVPPKTPPVVIVLQEVTHNNWVVFRNHLGRAGFRFYPDEPPPRSYFELTAIGASAKLLQGTTEPLPSTVYDRQLHSLDIEIGSSRIRVMQAHLDSGPERRVSAIRVEQTQEVVSRLKSSHLPTLFAGDTNLRSHEWNQVETSSVTDAWESLGEPAWGRSTWPAPGTRGRKARFDRVWFNSGFRVSSMEMLGSRRLPGIDRAPSDHLGLRLELESRTTS